MARAVSPTELDNTKHEDLILEGEWKDAFGEPELAGCWMFWAQSGSGKTTFVCQLAKMLTRFGKVLYNSLEEGSKSKTMKMAFHRVKMSEVGSKVLLVEEPMDELKERLRKHKAPRIVIIDSWQYTGMTYRQHIAFKREFPNCLIIYISHAEGKEPAGKHARSVRYDCSIKGFVQGYRMFPVSRYGGNKPYDIWKEGAARFYGDGIMNN